MNTNTNPAGTPVFTVPNMMALLSAEPLLQEEFDATRGGIEERVQQVFRENVLADRDLMARYVEVAAAREMRNAIVDKMIAETEAAIAEHEKDGRAFLDLAHKAAENCLYVDAGPHADAAARHFAKADALCAERLRFIAAKKGGA